MSPTGLDLVRYDSGWASAWDAHVWASKNGTFLFERGFMDYHRDRFEDHSVLAVEPSSKAILAILPAHRRGGEGGDRLLSHGGLTYGGWVTDERMTAGLMLDLFVALRDWLRARGFTHLTYKPVPRVFHRGFADDDLYALHALGARIVAADAGSAIDLDRPLRWSKGKRHARAKARKAGVRVARSDDFAAFWLLLAEVLEARHGAVPVHSPSELERLAAAFPDQIRLYTASVPGEDRERLASGLLLFDCGQAAHCQYMASNDLGRGFGGLEAIVDHLVTDVCAGKRALSFGVSSEQGGKLLNRGLQAQKEMFGARTLLHVTYDLDLRPEPRA